MNWVMASLVICAERLNYIWQLVFEVMRRRSKKPAGAISTGLESGKTEILQLSGTPGQENSGLEKVMTR